VARVNVPRCLALVLAAAVLAPAGAGAQAAPTDPSVVATLPRATVVGAAGGWTAWSAYEGGRYVLVTRSPAGRQAPAPVAPRRVPFDLDLGTDAAGRVIAAYSRCAKEPTLVGGANATAPNYTSGRGCRIALYDLAARTERRLTRSRGSASDVLPSVGGSRIAFVAVPSARRLAGRALLRWRTAAARSTARTLDTGVRRTGPPTVSGGPAGVDTDGKRVAAVWRYEDTEFHDFNSVLRVGTFTGKPRQVGYGVNGEACSYDQVLAPTLAGGTVSYLETNGAEWVLERTSVTRRAPAFGLSRTGEPGVVATSAALDGGRLVVAETASAGVGRAAGTTQIRELPAGAFDRTSPITFCDAG
jgi:hypothetical protein